MKIGQNPSKKKAVFIKTLFASVALFLVAHNASACDTTTSTITGSDCTNLTLPSTAGNASYTIDQSTTVLAGSSANAITLSGTIGSFTNNGSIGSVTSSAYGIYVNTAGVIGGDFINNGAIASNTLPAVYFDVRSSISGSLINSSTGVISAENFAAANFAEVSINTLSNAGQIKGYYDGIGLYGARIGTLNNSGAIGASLFGGSGGNGLYLTRSISGAHSSIDTLVNSGSISSTDSAAIYLDRSVSSIGTLTNTGSIYAGASQPGITNLGTITTVNNSQGVGNQNGALKYTGVLPTNYNIIINGPAQYGQLSATSVTGRTTFGIYAGSVVANGTYSSVLSGFSSSSLLNTSGSYGGGSWSLVNSSGSLWDLVFSGIVPPVTTTNIAAGSSGYLSGIGTTLNPVFAGGTLILLNGDNSNQAFVVESTGGTISSPTTGSATLGGVFSGSGAMTFNGSGITYMNGINTYTGGTTVASGTLSVGSSGAYSTARLAGDVNVQAAGTLAGHGGIAGTVTNSGTVAPGGSIGTLSVGGNYVQTSGGTLSTSITPSENSVLAVAGRATIAGNFSIDASAGLYTKRSYTVLTSSGLTGKFSNVSGNLASYSPLGAYLSYDANNAYLELVASRADTQQSLVNAANVLQGIYTLQNTVLVNGFSYDCNLFGANNVCVSAGGRNTSVQAEGMNNTSALLIAAYRPAPNYRVGAWADQNLSMNSPGGTVKLGNNTPVLGVFGAWNERADGSGTEIKVAAGYGQKNATITRAVVGTSDAGSGSSNLTTQGAQLQAKYGYVLLDNAMISPYIGVRYTQSNMGAYSEGYNANVTAPLTYQALNTNATTAIAGVGVSYKPFPAATLFASAAVETDTSTSNGSYSASSVKIAGLSPVNFNANPVKTRPTATVGATYDVEKNQRLGITGIYRQEAYQAVSTTTVMAAYTVGF